MKSPRSNPQVFYFQDNLNVAGLFQPDGQTDPAQFGGLWRSIPDGQERVKLLPAAVVHDVASLSARLAAGNVFVSVQRPLDGSRTAVYASAKLPPGAPLLVELSSVLGQPGVKVAIKSPQPEYAQMALAGVEALLS